MLKAPCIHFLLIRYYYILPYFSDFQSVQLGQLALHLASKVLVCITTLNSSEYDLNLRCVDKTGFFSAQVLKNLVVYTSVSLKMMQYYSWNIRIVEVRGSS